AEPPIFSSANGSCSAQSSGTGKGKSALAARAPAGIVVVAGASAPSSSVVCWSTASLSMAEVDAGSGTGAAHPVSAITPTVPSRTANSLARIAFSFVRVNRQASEDPTGPVVAAAVADSAPSAQSEGVRLLMISDTHLPVRAKKLPAEVWDAETGRASARDRVDG